MNSLIIFILMLVIAFALSSKEIRSRHLVVPAGQPEGRITNGKVASEGQFPYQVGINIQKKNLKFNWCGGSIINNEWVLTAAHCFEDVIVFLLIMGVTGPENIDGIEYVLDLKSVIMHNDYNIATHEHDIAVIKIPFTNYTEKIQPAKLPELCQTYSAFDKERVIASGWGCTSVKDPQFNETLHWALLDTIPNNICKLDVRIQMYSTTICTIPIGGGNICFGDSGGPLVLEGSKTQIGIVSTGYGIRKLPAIGVYTRLTSYLEWIEKTIGVTLKKCSSQF